MKYILILVCIFIFFGQDISYKGIDDIHHKFLVIADDWIHEQLYANVKGK